MQKHKWTSPLLLAALCLAFPAGASALQLAKPLYPLTAVKDPRAAKPKRVKTVWDFTPYTGGQAAYPALRRRTVADKQWLLIRLPGRPNHGLGWIPAEGVKLVHAQWSLRVDISNRILLVRHNGKMVRRQRVVVGAPSTPTPLGDFFIEDHMRLKQRWARSGWGLATTAYSNVLRHFDGGEGQVAIHTTGSLRDPLGSAASHGCIRVPPRFAKWLAMHIPSGSPLKIVR